MRITMVLLTYNRKAIVQRALVQVFANAGFPIDELVYVDNGSTDGVAEWVMDTFRPDVCVLNKDNLGDARGYNRGFVLSAGDWIVVTDGDMLMPSDWLLKMKTAVETIPNSGVVSMFSHPLVQVPERIRGAEQIVKGIKMRPVIPMEPRMMSRRVLEVVGYLREDFGLYGWADVEWAERCYRRCKEHGLVTYILSDEVPEHLGTEGVSPADGKEATEYHAFKVWEANEPKKTQLMHKCHMLGYPYYNPFI